MFRLRLVYGQAYRESGLGFFVYLRVFAQPTDTIRHDDVSRGS